jgi:hypothetical protein
MKVTELLESGGDLRAKLIDKMRLQFERNGKYINCRLAVQLTVDVPKLEELPKVKPKEMILGDILAWGIAHFAIYLGNGEVLEVPGWGDQVQITPLKAVEADYDKVRTVYRVPADQLQKALQ